MREGAPGANDCFRPPEIPVEVYCAHCQQEFESYLIHWVEDASYSSGGYWSCPTPGCDGKGFTFDIWPTDPDWTDEHGNKVCFFDDDDEVAEDWAADLVDVGPDQDEVFDNPDEEPTVEIIDDPDTGLLIPEADIADADDEDYAPMEFDDEMTWPADDRRNRTRPAAERISDTLEFHSDDDLSF